MDDIGQTAEHLVVRIARRSAAEDVRAQLAALIATGQLKVNERLPPEIELARSFGVSRSVIREALVSLRAHGLTSSQTGKGTFVAATRAMTPLFLGRYSAADLNEVRRYLEIPCARLAALRRSEADLARLGEAMAAVEATEDAARRNQLDAGFHIAIALASGNPLLVRLVEDLRTILEEHSLAVSVVPERRAQASAEHRAIHGAILRRDAAGAGAAMAAHLDAVDACLAALRRTTRGGARRGGR